MTKLAELGRAVAREQDLQRERQPHDELAVTRFARSLNRPEPVQWRTAVIAGALVAAAAAAVIGVWRGRHVEAPSLLADAPAIGEPLVARDGQSVPLNFPDGSKVVLTPGTEAFVQELSASGAKLQVSRGKASVSVRHQSNTSWLIGAGPYRVHVTGTRFSVAWAPERKHFELQLKQGSVVITTEAGSHVPVRMVAPESLVIDPDGWQLSSPHPIAAGTSLPVPEESAEMPPAVAPTTGSSAPARQLVQQPSWEALAHAGKYSAAYGEAARHGIAQLADALHSNALLSLAEACRFSGHGGEATQVLARLRARFPGTNDAATAAFQLGRFANDASAANWFRTYLQERPNGALAREASGRLLEVLSRSGDRVSARQAAERYLTQYPSGTHAAFARQLLGK